MKKHLLSIALLVVTIAGCSKSEQSQASQNIDPTGSKYRVLSWSVGSQAAWQYDVLEFKANGVLLRDLRMFNDSKAHDVPADTLKWAKTSTGVNVWLFSNLAPYPGTVTATGITLKMAGSDTREYVKY